MKEINPQVGSAQTLLSPDYQPLSVLLRAGSSITQPYFWQVDSEGISAAPL